MKKTPHFLIAFALAAVCGAAEASSSGVSAVAPAPDTQAILEQRKQRDETIWGPEVKAQIYEKTFIKLWDDLLAGDEPYERIAKFPVGQVLIGARGTAEQHDWGVTVTPFTKEDFKTFDYEQWKSFLSDMQNAGYRIVELEFHHRKFELREGQEPRSGMNVMVLVEHKERGERYAIKGDMVIDWSARKDENGNFIPETIDTTPLKITAWKGGPVFERVFSEPNMNAGWSWTLAYDLNGDGLTDLVLPNANSIIWNRGQNSFDSEPLFPEDQRQAVIGALIADFTKDGLLDLVIGGKMREGDPRAKFSTTAPAKVTHYPGKQGGGFSLPGQVILERGADMPMPHVMSAGDIDNDGDLDLFVGQAFAYGESIPAPYYDFNNGLDAYLLRNDGNGAFKDVTEESGIAAKRKRLYASGSFIDMNDDGFLDLFTTSDYAGADLFLNDGKGRFTDATSTALDDNTAFGMGHSFADYNLDGKLDAYISGMSSTTARRLEDMKLERSDKPDFTKMRMRMGYGNRMFLAQGDGKFQQPQFKDQVARAGWSWGNTAFDFDSDGDPDIYVANGFWSRGSTVDYCTTFWTHDIYDSEAATGKTPNPAMLNLIMNERSKEVSWNGYEHNRLFMNERGSQFVEVGFPVGVAFQDDTRSALSDDFDLDGKPDLAMSMRSPKEPQRMEIYRNEWPIQNHWIGVRLKDEPGRSPIGARITVGTSQGNKVARIVTGDSFQSQHANLKNFGLGNLDAVDFIEVKWLDGTVKRIEKPAVDRYYDVSAA